MNNYTWEEYQQFIQENSLKLEDEEGELKLYNYFDTLEWKYNQAIVLFNKILLQGEYLENDFYLAKEVYLTMKEKEN